MAYQFPRHEVLHVVRSYTNCSLNETKELVEDLELGCDVADLQVGADVCHRLLGWYTRFGLMGILQEAETLAGGSGANSRAHAHAYIQFAAVRYDRYRREQRMCK